MTDQTIKNVYRLAYIPDGTVPDCAYRFQLPDPVRCPFIGYHPTRVLQLLTYATMDPSVKLRVSPAKGFSAKNAADNQSIMGQLVHGLADVSPALMSFTTSRANQANYIQVEDVRPSVKLAELFPSYIVYPLVFSLLFFVPIRVLLHRWPFRRCQNPPKTKSADLKLKNSSSLKDAQGTTHRRDLKEYFSRFSQQTELYLSLFIVIILGIMQTDLVIKFNRKLTVNIFDTIDDFVGQIEQRKFVGVTNSRVNFALVLDPVKYAGKNPYADRILTANRDAGQGIYAPMKVGSVQEALDLVREHSNSEAKPDLVFVTGAGTMSIIELNATNLCDLKNKKAEYFGRGAQIMYYRRNLTFPRIPGPDFVKLFEEDSRRLSHRTKILPNCTVFDRLKAAQSRGRAQFWTSVFGALSLNQMQGAFVIFGICIGGCCVALLLETVRWMVKNRFKTIVSISDKAQLVSEGTNNHFWKIGSADSDGGRSASFVTSAASADRPSAARLYGRPKYFLSGPGSSEGKKKGSNNGNNQRQPRKTHKRVSPEDDKGIWCYS